VQTTLAAAAATLKTRMKPDGSQLNVCSDVNMYLSDVGGPFSLVTIEKNIK
jgi:hypothetical protein